MNAEILAVGTELLMGQIANTNAQYISRRLADLGIRVLYHSVVGDNPQRLADSLRLALSRVDVVITTGGLGPTRDDLTKETIASVFGFEMIRNEEVYGKIVAFFLKIGREMVPSNERQAWLPLGSTLIENHNGTAPGCIIEQDGKMVAMLPGPPKEMNPMFEETLFPWFESRTGQVLASRMLRIFGLGESLMEDRILDLIEAQQNPTLATYVGDGDVVLRVTAAAKTRGEAEQLLEPAVDAVRERLEPWLYTTRGESMEEVVAKLLLERNWKISTAESCTGGLIAAKLVNVPGVSALFERGFILYADTAKISELGVSPETLARQGAVSGQTAGEMAAGLMARTKCEVAVAVTGIAGPDGGTPEKPVGLVYVAVKTPDQLKVSEFRMNGDRQRIRVVTTLHALDMVRRMLLNLEDDVSWKEA